MKSKQGNEGENDDELKFEEIQFLSANENGNDTHFILNLISLYVLNLYIYRYIKLVLKYIYLIFSSFL